jgi:hypothetical protein
MKEVSKKERYKKSKRRKEERNVPSFPSSDTEADNGDTSTLWCNRNMYDVTSIALNSNLRTVTYEYSNSCSAQ